MITAGTIIVMCLFLAGAALWGVRRLDNPPTIAVLCAVLGSAGAVGLVALPLAALGNASVGGALGAGATLAAVSAPLWWLLLTTPRGWQRPPHGHPTVAAETVAADPPPARPDVTKYRVRSAAEAIAEAQGTAAPRSARVRRIVEMEV